MKRSIGFYIKISIVAVAVLVGGIYYICDNYKWWVRVEPEVVKKDFLDNKGDFNDVKNYLMTANIEGVIYYEDIDSYDIDPVISEKIKKILKTTHLTYVNKVDTDENSYIYFISNDNYRTDEEMGIVFSSDASEYTGGLINTDLGGGWYYYWIGYV